MNKFETYHIQLNYRMFSRRIKKNSKRDSVLCLIGLKKTMILIKDPKYIEDCH